MSVQQPTEAERVAKLQAEAAAAHSTYRETRYRGAATGNLTRGQQQGGGRR